MDSPKVFIKEEYNRLLKTSTPNDYDRCSTTTGVHTTMIPKSLLVPCRSNHQLCRTRHCNLFSYLGVS